MNYLISLVFVLLTISYYIIKKCIIQPFSFWQNKGVPFLKPVIPIGNFPILTNKSFIDMINDIYFKSNPKDRYVGVYQFLDPILMIRDLELIKEITTKQFDSFTDHRQLVPDDLDPLWNAGLAGMKGNKWRYMRTSLSPAFTANKMRFVFDLMDKCAHQTANYIEEKSASSGTFHGEMEDIFTRYTNDVFATCALDVKIDSLRDPNNDFYNKVGKAVTFRGLNVFKFFLIDLSPKLMKFFRIKLINNSTASFFSAIMENAMRLRRKYNIVRPDILHLLMEAQKGTLKNDDDMETMPENEQKISITDQDIIGQSYLFLLAGYDSVSLLITFTFYELAINPDVQKKLYDEIRATVGDSELNYSLISDMKYLNMVISESLRKWPPIPSTDRQATKTFVIKAVSPGEKDLVVEKGLSIGIPICAVHHDPKYFPEPEKFNPERFSDENRSSFNNSAYMPFGIGPRFCIGTRFALLETKILVANLLLKFEVVPIEKTLIPMVLKPRTINPVPKTGMWLGFKKR